MAYFNHAYHKCFVATKGNSADLTAPAPSQATYVDGILTDAGLHVSELKDTANLGLGPGITGFFGARGANKDLSLTAATIATDCCPFYLASSSIRINDKQGPFHGGYQASNK